MWTVDTMPDADFLAALQDPESFRRYIDAKLLDAVSVELQRIDDEEADRIIYGTSAPDA